MSDSNIWHPLTEEPPLRADGEQSIHVLIRHEGTDGEWEYDVVYRGPLPWLKSNKWYWQNDSYKAYDISWDEFQWTLIPDEEE